MQAPYFSYNQQQEYNSFDLDQKIRSKSYEMSLMQLDNPLKITFLRYTPKIYISLIVTIPKLDFYLKNYWDSLTKGLNQTGIEQLLNVYQRKLVADGVQKQYEPILYEHMCLFYYLVDNQEDSSPMINQYIKFQLAAGRTNFNLNRWLPKFVMRFTNLDYEVLFHCASQFLRNPQNYDFQDQADKFILKIKQKFEQFLQKYEVEQGTSIVNTVKQFIWQIKQTFNNVREQGIQHQIHEYALRYLLKSQQFCSQVFVFLKKFGFMRIFDIWIQLLIDLQQYPLSIFLIENLLYFYCNYASQARISDLIDKNPQWARSWAQVLSRNSVQSISPMFMSDQQCFIILNKILIYFQFDSEQSFLVKLDQIDYMSSVRKFGGEEKVKIAIIDLFNQFVHQNQSIIEQIFEQVQDSQK